MSAWDSPSVWTGRVGQDSFVCLLIMIDGLNIIIGVRVDDT